VSFGDRVLAGLRTIILIEERTRALDEVLKGLKSKVEDSLADHDRRLTRLETIVEITRPDGGTLRIAGEIGKPVK